jgi:hypothetical protein
MFELTGMSRRGLVGAAAASLVLTASNLSLPDWLQEAKAGEGAYGGRLGGRHGKNRRGREARTHDRRRTGDGPPPGRGLFRNTALTVKSFTDPPFTYTFYYRVKTGLDDYGPWIQSHSVTPDAGVSYRYAPSHFRIGVLVSAPAEAGPGQIFFEARNLAFGAPRGFMAYGSGLDPSHNILGTPTIPEREFDMMSVPVTGFYAVGETFDALTDVRRVADSDDFIEFQLIISNRS